MLMTSRLTPCLRKKPCSTPIHIAAIFSLYAPCAMRMSGSAAPFDETAKSAGKKNRSSARGLFMRAIRLVLKSRGSRGAQHLDELTIDSALAAEIEEILRLAPPAFRLGAADGDDERRAGKRRMQQGAVLAGGFRGGTDLPVDAHGEHGGAG